MTIRYEFCDTRTEDGMWTHPPARIRRDAFGGEWLMDGRHMPTDEDVMRPIIDAAMRDDKGSSHE